MTKKNSLARIAVVIFTVLFNTNLKAVDGIKIGIETQKLDGFSSYTIGGITESKFGQVVFHFPVSQLTFPSNIYTGKINVTGRLNQSHSFNLSFQKNLNSYSGKLEDSDWLSSKSTEKDIYSESDTFLNLLSYNAKWDYIVNSIIYPNNDKTTYTFSIGYEHQDFGFEARDLEQWYPSDPTKEKKTQEGKVITYDLSTKIPYWAFNINQTLGKASIGIGVGYSPYVKLSDKDDHVLRSKLAKGSLTGQMEFATLSLNYQFSKSFSSFINYQYRLIQSHGIQVQSRYQDTDEGKAGHIADLDEKIDSELSSLSFGLAYTFGQISSQEKQMFNKTQTFLPWSLGISYYIPFQEREASFGPQFELDIEPIILGVSYHKGNNSIRTFSKGVYTMIPIYALVQIPAFEHFKIQIGGGYSYNTNDIDPHVVSHLTTLGFPETKEVLKSDWLGIASISYKAPYGNGSVDYFLRYHYHSPKLHSYSENHNNLKKVDLSALQLGVKVRL